MKNWQERYINNYIESSKRVIQLIKVSQSKEDILNHSTTLLTSICTIQFSTPLDRTSCKLFIEFAMLLHGHVNNLGKWDWIIPIWTKIIELTEPLGENLLRIHLIKQVAVANLDLGRVNQASILFYQLIKSPRFDQLPHRIQADIYHQAGISHIRLSHYRLGQDHLLRCISLATQYDDFELIAYSLSQLGNIAQLMCDFDEAEFLYRESLLTFLLNGEADNLACVSYQSLGRFLVLQKRFNEAIPLLEIGLKIRRRRQELIFTAANAIYLAEAYIGCNYENGKVLALLDEAILICRNISEPRTKIRCHYVYGMLEAKQQNFEHAILHWKEALKLIEDEQMPHEEVLIIWTVLSSCLFYLSPRMTVELIQRCFRISHAHFRMNQILKIFRARILSISALTKMTW